MVRSGGSNFRRKVIARFDSLPTNKYVRIPKLQAWEKAGLSNDSKRVLNIKSAHNLSSGYAFLLCVGGNVMTECSKVYLVVANTYQSSWGAEIEVFMTTGSKDLANKELEKVKNEYSGAEVIEMNIDVPDRKYLGGYYE